MESELFPVLGLIAAIWATAARFLPGFKDRYDGMSKDSKRLTNLVFYAVLSAAYLLLKCFVAQQAFCIDVDAEAFVGHLLFVYGSSEFTNFVLSSTSSLFDKPQSPVG